METAPQSQRPPSAPERRSGFEGVKSFAKGVRQRAEDGLNRIVVPAKKWAEVVLPALVGSAVSPVRPDMVAAGIIANVVNRIRNGGTHASNPPLSLAEQYDDITKHRIGLANVRANMENMKQNQDQNT